MKAKSVHDFEPGEIPGTFRDLASRLQHLAALAKSNKASPLAAELSECSELFNRYATGIEYGVTVALTGDTFDLLLALALVEENLQEITVLAHQWPWLSDTPQCVREPLARLPERFEHLLHDINLIRVKIPALSTATTLSA